MDLREAFDSLEENNVSELIDELEEIKDRVDGLHGDEDTDSSEYETIEYAYQKLQEAIDALNDLL